MFETIGAFFIVGAFGFWLVLAILSFLIAAACFEDDDQNSSGGWTLLGIVVLTAFLWVSTGTSPVAFVKEHTWLEILMFISGYIVTGFGWSLFKWRNRIKKWALSKRAKVKAFKKEPVPNGFANDPRSMDPATLPKPEFQKSVDDVAFWFVFWPFSMLSYVIGEWLLDLLRWIGEVLKKLKGVYRWVEGSYGNE